jgi:hypothetical protein
MAGITYDEITGEISAVNHVRGCALDGGIDWKVGFLSVLLGRCCGGGEVPTREVRLHFIREELLYDIKNLAYVHHDMMDEQKKVVTGIDIDHARHLTADIGEEGNVDRVSRILSLVMSEVTDLLYPYTKEAPIEEEVDDMLQAPIAYDILMHVPDTMSRTTIRYLVNLIHEYMVCRVLADWLSITYPEAAAKWRGDAESVRMEINRTKNLRRGPLTRKISTF